jgi:hypothetical protein
MTTLRNGKIFYTYIIQRARLKMNDEEYDWQI